MLHREDPRPIQSASADPFGDHRRRHFDREGEILEAADIRLITDNAVEQGADRPAQQPGEVKVIYIGPTKNTAGRLIHVIKWLIAQCVDAIAIAIPAGD